MEPEYSVQLEHLITIAKWGFGIIGTILLLAAGLFVRSNKASHKFGKWQEEVDTDRKAFKDFMKEIRQDIKKILERLPQRTIESTSPLRLTDLGKKISQIH